MIFLLHSSLMSCFLSEGEVIDPSCEGADNSTNGASDSGDNESDEHSGVSCELSESEAGDVEDQSPEVSTRGS